MAWFYLVVAGVFEVAWAIALKHTHGFTRLWPSVATAVGLALSMFFLALAVRTLPIGTAYAIWVGIGAVGTAILGALLFAEPLTAPRVFFLALLLVAIVGLKMST